MKRLKMKNWSFRVGFMITAVMSALIITGFFWTPYDSEKMSGAEKFLAPCIRHIFGCDHFGRDIFSRVLKGGGTTFLIALCTILASALIGTVIGAVSAYVGGVLDEVLMRIVDAIASFPSVLLALVMIGLFGPGKYKILAALIIAFIPSFTRVMRGEFLKYKAMDYVKSARLMGAGPLRILALHIFPLTVTTLLSSMTIGFNNAVLAEASMSYLGLGVTPPDPSLGRMLSEGQGYLTSSPWCVLGPGLFMIILVLGAGLLGDGIAADDGKASPQKPSTVAGIKRAALRLKNRGERRKHDRQTDQ